MPRGLHTSFSDMTPENRALLVIALAVALVVGGGAGSVLLVSSLLGSAGGLRVVASVERSVVAANETVDVTVTLTNEGPTALNLSWSCQGDGIQVTNAAGQVVYDSRRGICALVIVVGTLPPGATRTSVYPWTADVPPLARYYIVAEVPSGGPGENLGTSVWVI